MPAVYVITKQCKYKNIPCAKCKYPLKLTKRYILSPEEYVNGLPKAYHVHCYQTKDTYQ